MAHDASDSDQNEKVYSVWHVFGINDLSNPSVMGLLCPHLFRECPRETMGHQLSLWFSPSHPSKHRDWARTGLEQNQYHSVAGSGWAPIKLAQNSAASLLAICVAKCTGIQCPQPPRASFIQALITIISPPA